MIIKEYIERVNAALPHGYTVEELKENDYNTLVGYITAWYEMHNAFACITDPEPKRIVEKIENELIDDVETSIDSYMISAACDVVISAIDGY